MFVNDGLRSVKILPQRQNINKIWSLGGTAIQANKTLNAKMNKNKLSTKGAVKINR